MKVTKEELLAKARKPAEDAMRMHPFYPVSYTHLTLPTN